MKKNYLKPQVASVNIEVENYVLGASTLHVDPDKEETPLSGKSRGEWGNVWSENK